MAKGFAHMSASEIDVALHLRQQGKSLGDIAGLLGRSKEAIRENTTPGIGQEEVLEDQGQAAAHYRQQICRHHGACRAHDQGRGLQMGGHVAHGETAVAIQRALADIIGRVPQRIC